MAIQNKFLSLSDFIYGQADPQGLLLGGPRSTVRDDGAGNIGEYANPYYGMDKSGIVSNYLKGQDPKDWFNNYVNTKFPLQQTDANGINTGWTDSSNRPLELMPNGMVRLPQHPNTMSDAAGFTLFAAPVGLAAGAVAAAGAAGASAGTGAAAGGALPFGESAYLAAEPSFGSAAAGTATGGAVENWTDYLSELYGGSGSPTPTTPVSGGWEDALGQAWGDAAGQSSTMNSALSGKSGFVQALMNDPVTALQTLNQLPADVLSSIGSIPGAQNALSKILNGTAEASDYASLAGKLLASGLGAFASSQQAKDQRALADKYLEFGAPSRARYETSFLPGFSMENEPGYRDALDQTTKAFLHKASVTGNPADSPNAWMQTLKDVNSTFAFPALQDYRRTSSAAGGLTALTSAAPGFDTAAVKSTGNIYDALGAGAADIFNPPKSLADILKNVRLV